MKDRHVSMISKLASLGGQDLRTPFAGGTKFPTDDSKQPAMDKLEHSQHAAEVGAAPTLSQLKPKGPSLQEVSVKMPTTQGSLPMPGQSKIAQAIANDPLVLYLKKQGEEMGTNLDTLLADVEKEPETASEPPQISHEYTTRALRQEDDLLEKLFGKKE